MSKNELLQQIAKLTAQAEQAYNTDNEVGANTLIDQIHSIIASDPNLTAAFAASTLDLYFGDTPEERGITPSA